MNALLVKSTNPVLDGKMLCTLYFDHAGSSSDIKLVCLIS